jgi:hypothetical protein
MKRLLLLTCMATAVFTLIHFNQSEVTAVSSSGNEMDWLPAVALTDAPQGAFGPHLATSDDGRLLLAYIRRESNGNDPYYRWSGNNGQSWSTAQPIYSSSTDAVQVHAVYDQSNVAPGNVAHAVWIEDESEIRYARLVGGTWQSQAITGSFAPPLDSPRLVASGSNRLDLLFVASFFVYHTYSTNGGTSWSNPTVIGGPPPILILDLTVDNSGSLHAVWTQATFDLLGEIAYTRGTVSGGGSVTWSQPVAISDPDIDNANNPKVVVHNSALNVFFTDRVEDDEQYVYRIQCSHNCTQGHTSWSGLPVSGSLMGVNTSDPFNVVSTAVSHQGCLFSYFHGTSPFDQTNTENEVIRGVNNCAGWAISVRDVVTSDTHRSVFPTLASQGNWLHLAYESGLAGGVRQIIFRRAEVESKLYLPIIAR